MQMPQNVKVLCTLGRTHILVGARKKSVVRFIYWRKPQYFSQLKLPEKSVFHMSSKAV